MLEGFQNINAIHPIFVHFPIAFVIGALVMEIIFIFKKDERFKKFAEWLIYSGAFMAIIAVLSGFKDTDFFGHSAPGHNIVHSHRDIMICMSGILVLTAITTFLSQKYDIKFLRKTLIFSLLIISSLLIYGADIGANLVFNYGHGVNTTQNEQDSVHHDDHKHEEERDHKH